MKFCSECAHPVALAIPEGDNRPRYVCGQCDAIHYQNPNMVIGSVPLWKDDGETRVLLCRRAERGDRFVAAVELTPNVAVHSSDRAGIGNARQLDPRYGGLAAHLCLDQGG